LFMAPVVSACTMGWSSRANRVVACSIADAPADGSSSGQPGDQATALPSPRVVVRSIEPALAPPTGRADVPVVFPGYVLPDDNFEDRAHEGG
jgi:hypothetical protein